MGANFVVSGKSGRNKVEAVVRANSPETALRLGKKELNDRYGPVSGVSVRYATSDFQYNARDFVDENRDKGDGDD